MSVEAPFMTANEVFLAGLFFLMGLIAGVITTVIYCIRRRTSEAAEPKELYQERETPPYQTPEKDNDPADWWKKL
jgi:hypothetical protein